MASGECLAVLSGHGGEVVALALRADGALLASGSFDGTIRLWDVATAVEHAGAGAHTATLNPHAGVVYAVAFSRKGDAFASGDAAGMITIWNLPTLQPIATLRGEAPYAGMRSHGANGLTDAQRATLRSLGALDELDQQQPAASTPAPAARGQQPPISHPPSPISHPNNAITSLPSQPTLLVGRSVELATLARLLSEPACRLLSLVGPGGIGKTRLALEIAANQASAFADGVAFVALASVNTPAHMVSAIGDALGVTFAGQPNVAAPLLGSLRGRHMLLVLDNFEHLLEGADLVAEIIQHAPRVSILVTSRQRLNLQAEWLFDVEGLAYPLEEMRAAARPALLAELADYSAVQLFIQRARQVQPDLPLSETALLEIVQICRHVAGMPLAIELAAGIRNLPIGVIEQRIRINLDVLATTLRDVPARHRSMRAVFDHSWNLLSAAERELFARLAAFRGGWTLEAAEAVCTEGKRQKIQESNANADGPLLPSTFSLLPLLTALADKSLVRRESAATEPYFSFSEPIREYALERLSASPNAEAVLRRHARYFTALAEAAKAQWGTPMINAAIAQQRREHDNMRAALQWACDTGDSQLGLQLAGALWSFWRSYGYISEGRAWLEQLLSLDQRPTEPAAIALRQRGLHAAAWLASDQHDYATATQLFQERLRLRRASGELADPIDLLLNSARQARAVGQYQQATALLEGALARHRAVGEPPIASSASLELSVEELGQVLRELGLVLREQGDFARAAALFEEGITLHRAHGDRASEAFSLIGLADIARDQGDSAGVREHCKPCLTTLRELGIQWAVGFALNTLALGALYRGDLAGAYALVDESIALFRDLQSDASRAEVLITLGQITRAQGDSWAAYAALAEALQLASALGPRLMVAAALEGLASVLAERGSAETTVQLLVAAAALRAQMGTPVQPADQASLDHAVATTRALFGEAAFAATWEAAAALSIEQQLGRIRATLDEEHP